jgi:hypothetical protein
MKRASVLLMVTVLFAGCGGEAADTETTATATPTTSTMPPATVPFASDCSGAGAPPLEEQPELPPEVAGTRSSVAETAAACDIDGLAQLARRDPAFGYAFGAAGDPMDYWIQLEAAGEAPLGHLLAILNLPYGILEAPAPNYMWPSAATYPTWSEVPRADQEAVISALGAEYEEEFRIHDVYTGPRTAILENGTWILYVTSRPG